MPSRSPHRPWAVEAGQLYPFGEDQRAEELYLDGVEKLEVGHRDFARQTFEQVIARYPVHVPQRPMPAG